MDPPRLTGRATLHARKDEIRKHFTRHGGTSNLNEARVHGAQRQRDGHPHDLHLHLQLHPTHTLFCMQLSLADINNPKPTCWRPPPLTLGRLKLGVSYAIVADIHAFVGVTFSTTNDGIPDILAALDTFLSEVEGGPLLQQCLECSGGRSGDLCALLLHRVRGGARRTTSRATAKTMHTHVRRVGRRGAARCQS
jgi:hypothetical protein